MDDGRRRRPSGRAARLRGRSPGRPCAVGPRYSCSKAARRSGRQCLERGAGSGAADPLEDRVLPVQDVEVGGLPGIGLQSETLQGAQVGRRIVRGGHGHVPHVLGIGLLRGQIAPDPMAGLLEVARHLHREPATWCEHPHQARKQREMVVHPLQGRVGHEHVHGCGRLPAAEIRSHGGDPGDPSGSLDHLRTGVDGGHLGVRPALGEQRRQGAGAGTEVHHASRSVGVDPRGELEERTRPLVLVAEVLLRAPAVRHRDLSHRKYLEIKVPCAGMPHKQGTGRRPARGLHAPRRLSQRPRVSSPCRSETRPAASSRAARKASSEGWLAAPARAAV